MNPTAASPDRGRRSFHQGCTLAPPLTTQSVSPLPQLVHRKRRSRGGNIAATSSIRLVAFSYRRQGLDQLTVSPSGPTVTSASVQT